MMSSILLTRIDNRLVHGQVGTAWARSVGANLLVVADDDAAADTVQQQLMKMTADSLGYGIRFFTIAKTIEIIHKASPEQKILLVCRTPKSVRQILEGKVVLDQINVGNMHFSEGKKAISTKVYVDQNDMEDLDKILDYNVSLFIQDVPDDSKKNLTKDTLWKLL